MSASDTLRSIGRTAVGAAALFVLYPMAFAAGFLGTLAGPAWRAAPDPLQRAGRDLSGYLAARRREREAVAAAKMRAEVRAAKAAKRAAREERKRLRRAWKAGFPDSDMAYLSRMLGAHVARARMLRAEGQRLSHEHRELLRSAELSYAIACAAAGAVPS